MQLDVGNLTASNRDAVTELRARLARVSLVLVQIMLGASPHAVLALVECDYAACALRPTKSHCR